MARGNGRLGQEPARDSAGKGPGPSDPNGAVQETTARVIA